MWGILCWECLICDVSMVNVDVRVVLGCLEGGRCLVSVLLVALVFVSFAWIIVLFFEGNFFSLWDYVFCYRSRDFFLYSSFNDCVW